MFTDIEKMADLQIKFWLLKHSDTKLNKGDLNWNSSQKPSLNKEDKKNEFQIPENPKEKIVCK